MERGLEVLPSLPVDGVSISLMTLRREGKDDDVMAASLYPLTLAVEWTASWGGRFLSLQRLIQSSPIWPSQPSLPPPARQQLMESRRCHSQAASWGLLRGYRKTTTTGYYLHIDWPPGWSGVIVCRSPRNIRNTMAVFCLPK